MRRTNIDALRNTASPIDDKNVNDEHDDGFALRCHSFLIFSAAETMQNCNLRLHASAVEGLPLQRDRMLVLLRET